MKYSFLFGAGAEKPFGLPSGPDFVIKSLIKKNKVLVNYFKKNNGYKVQYILYSNNNRIFKEMILETIDRLKNNSNKLQFKKKLEEYKTNYKIQNIFNKINNGKKFDEIENLIINNLKYEGNIEKYFYSLIGSEFEKNNSNYYKLFNYFWFAYFSILEPLLKCTKYKDFSTNYNYIFDHFDEIITYIYSKEFLDEFVENFKKENNNKENNNSNKNYYELLLELLENKKIEIESILTTNYTPFVELYFDNNVYLSGKLNCFEIPKLNMLFEIKKPINKNIKIDENEEKIKINLQNYYDKDKNNLNYIPFMMTQAPVKPIIHPIQIEEYNKAIQCLLKSDCLVIIGYSLCYNDYHILAIIKYFLNHNPNKKLIFCYYYNDKDALKTKEEVSKRLKLDNCEQIEVFRNDGNIEDLYNKILGKENNKNEEIKN